MNEIFAKVIYLNKELHDDVKKAANQKFDGESYVKNLWILNTYKKRGGKVKYEGKRPSKDQIKKNVDKEVKRLRSEASLVVDMSEVAVSFILNQEFKLIESSEDSEIKELKEHLETLAYISGDEDFEQDYVEGEEKKNVKLNKPFRTPSGPKKYSVYVKNDKGNIVKVNFGDPNMEIKRDDPERRKSFRARHKCDSPGPRWKAKYWSCKFWSSKKVSDIVGSEHNTEASYEGVFDKYDEYTEAPLAKPKKGQSEKDFIRECMSDPVMNQEFPENDQRYAVCLRQFENKD